jgi:hypothetical protein
MRNIAKKVVMVDFDDNMKLFCVSTPIPKCRGLKLRFLLPSF